MSTKPKSNWGTVYVRRRKGEAPAGIFREVKPDPLPDFEAAVEALAEQRKERAERLQDILDAWSDA